MRCPYSQKFWFATPPLNRGIAYVQYEIYNIRLLLHDVKHEENNVNQIYSRLFNFTLPSSKRKAHVFNGFELSRISLESAPNAHRKKQGQPYHEDYAYAQSE